MKNFLKSFVAYCLAILSRAILRKYKPQVVMITGSVGKTSTKDAVAACLKEKFYLRASEKSYNSEFGVPLTIIGAKNPWLNFWRWITVLEEALALFVFKNHYPKLLVLEVGADRPGDLRRILDFVTPDAVVVTRLPEVPVHVEAYASPEAVRQEEFSPAYALLPDAPLVISSDDTHAVALASRLPATVYTYGSEEGTVKIMNVRTFSTKGKLAGMEADVVVDGETHVLRAEGVLGRQQLGAPGAALALARALGLTTKQALKGLQSYVPPPGRARLLEGVNDSVLIDDTYNASPAAVEEILHSLSYVEQGRKVAILGDMLELGRYSVEEHARIGKLAAELVDVVVGVGPRSRAVIDAARSSGKDEQHALYFGTSDEAAEALPALITENDLVLIKGSQSIRMERITKALLKNEKDEVFLVRQEKEWLKR